MSYFADAPRRVSDFTIWVDSSPPGQECYSRSAVAQHLHVGQISDALLSLTAAMAARVDVGLMAVTRRAPSGGDLLLPLLLRPSESG